MEQINPDLISLKQLAQLMEEVNWQTVYNNIRKRAARGKYSSYQKIKGEGYININDSEIPVSIRIKFSNSNSAISPLLNKERDLPESRQAGEVNCIENELSTGQLKTAIARADLIIKYLSSVNSKTNSLSLSKERGRGEVLEAKHKFINAFNNQAFPELFSELGEITFKTLERWKKNYLASKKDYRALAPQYKIKKQSSITPQESEVLVKLICTPNKPLVNEVIRQAVNYFEAKRFPYIHSYSTYKRWIEEWIKNNWADYIFYREGEKGLDDKVLPYLERDWNKVEVGDILIMDGHVNNYEIINPITGQAKRMITVGVLDGRSQYFCGYEISITENILSIASALRRAILQLGKIPKIVYIDNGRAFTAKYFHGDNKIENIIPLFERLGIQTIIAKAYHAQSKPIEPFWDWMSELERLLPTYTGTSIANKPARMNRGEKLHVKLYQKAMFATTIDIFTAHRAMAWWLDDYHLRNKQSGHLKGLNPAQVFAAGKGPGVDKAKLNYLMMDMTITKLYRKGIRLFGTWYWNPALFGKLIDAGDDVHVKYDLFDRNSILVYDKTGALVCEARDVSKVHPAAELLGTDEEKQLVKEQLRLKEELKSTVVGPAKQFLKDEIYPFTQQQLKSANILQLENSPSPSGEGRGEVAVKRSKKKKSITDRWGIPEDQKPKTIDKISRLG